MHALVTSLYRPASNVTGKTECEGRIDAIRCGNLPTCKALSIQANTTGNKCILLLLLPSGGAGGDEVSILTHAYPIQISEAN